MLLDSEHKKISKLCRSNFTTFACHRPMNEGNDLISSLLSLIYVITPMRTFAIDKNEKIGMLILNWF